MLKMPLLTPWDIWAKPGRPTREDFIAGHNDARSANLDAGPQKREGISLRAYLAGLDQYKAEHRHDKTDSQKIDYVIARIDAWRGHARLEMQRLEGKADTGAHINQIANYGHLIDILLSIKEGDKK